MLAFLLKINLLLVLSYFSKTYMYIVFAFAFYLQMMSVIPFKISHNRNKVCNTWNIKVSLPDIIPGLGPHFFIIVAFEMCFIELKTCCKWCVVLFMSIESCDVDPASKKIFYAILSAPTPKVLKETISICWGVFKELVVTFIIICGHEVCRWALH